MRKIFVLLTIIFCSVLARAQSPIPTYIVSDTTILAAYTGTNTLAAVKDTGDTGGMYLYDATGTYVPDGSASFVTSVKGGIWIHITPVNGGSPIGAYTGSNGITLSGADFQWRGTLNQNTTINGAGFYSRFSGGRLQAGQGAAVTAANDLTLGNDGNTFSITGATQINAITTLNWQAGSVVNLIFASTPTVKNNTAGGAGTAVILLAGSTDFTAAANDVLTLLYDGTSWHETARQQATSGGQFWTLPSGGTMTGVNTLTSAFGNAWLWSNTFTASATGQYSHHFVLNGTFRATAGDTLYGVKIWGNGTLAAATQNYVMLDVEPNITNGSSFAGEEITAVQVGGHIYPKTDGSFNVGTRADLGRHFNTLGANASYVESYRPLTTGSPIFWEGGTGIDLGQILSSSASQLSNAFTGTTLQIATNGNLDATANGYGADIKLQARVAGALTITALGTPSAPVITNFGVAGSTAYTYKVVAIMPDGRTTEASASGSTATGNATLDNSNFNQVTITEVVGAVAYEVYRTASSGTPSSTGKIGRYSAGSFSTFVFQDKGLAGDSGTPPAVNTTGNLNLPAGGAIYSTEGANGRVGVTTLVSGTKAITINGVTTSSRAFVQVVAQGGTSTGVYQYKAVCTSNTLTITAIDVTGATVATDTSVLNYFVVN